MATNFLASTGTNGFITSAAVTAFSSGTTTLNSITNNSIIVSTTVFTQTNTAQGLYGYVSLTIGSSFVSGAGGNVAGWWLFSPDGGTTFETTNTVRAPDFIIPLTTSTSTGGGTPSSGPSGGLFLSPLVAMPWSTFKVLLQNNTGVTIGTSGNSIAYQTVAVQY